MKFTTVLCKLHYGRLMERMWKKQSQLQIAPLQISPELQQLGVKIHDALDVARELNSWDDPPTTDSTEIWNTTSPPQKFFLFHERTRTTETEDQALCLTKTISYPGLPSALKSLVGVEQLPNQDHLVQRCIKQALIYDSQYVKLPRRVDVLNPGFVYIREYGIRFKRKVVSMMEKLSRLCEMTYSKYPELLLERHNISETFSEVVIKKDDDTIVFQIPGDILVTSRTPLKPFASPSEVEATKDIALPSIHPIKPTLDLDQSDVSPAKRADDIHILEKPNPFHVHTLHVVNKTFGFWFPYQKLSKGIVSCFTYAAEEARRLYGKDVKILPHPVSIQCIYSDITNVGILAYQLNTLDFSSDDGIKNQVWIEEAQDLCKVIHERHRFEVTGLEEYNDTVFPKMLAVYLNGANVCSS